MLGSNLLKRRTSTHLGGTMNSYTRHMADAMFIKIPVLFNASYSNKRYTTKMLSSLIRIVLLMEREVRI